MVITKCGAICGHCKTTENLQVDHIVSLSEGGSNELENLQILCAKCNKVKGGNRGKGKPRLERRRVPYAITLNPEVSDWLIEEAKKDNRKPSQMIGYLLHLQMEKSNRKKRKSR